MACGNRFLAVIASALLVVSLAGATEGRRLRQSDSGCVNGVGVNCSPPVASPSPSPAPAVSPSPSAVTSSTFASSSSPSPSPVAAEEPASPSPAVAVSPSPEPLASPQPEAAPSPSPEPLPPSPSPTPLQFGVHTRCPLGCAEGGCLATTAGGYTCGQCKLDLVVNTTDGTCSCPEGRYAKLEYDCVDCPKGSWCAGGTYAGIGSPGAIPCGEMLTTAGMRSTSITFCVNIPGTYYAVDAETEAPMAITCPADTYGPGLKKQRACVPCPPGTTTGGLTGRTSINGCGVPEGYFMPSPGVVAPCPMGEYKVGVGAAGSCTKCPHGTSTESFASPSADYCNVLVPGYSPLNITEDGGIAETQLCPQGFYCPGGVPFAMFDAEWGADGTEGTTVVRCPNGTWTQGIGATGEDQCMTPPGFETVNGATTECPDTAYRAEWMPVTATSGAQCIPCGNGISASPTDYISVYAPTPDANVTLLPVKISGASCYIRPGQGIYYSAATDTYTAKDCGSGQYGLPNVTYGLLSYPCRSCPTGTITSQFIPESAQYYVDYGNGRGGFTSEKACVTQAGYGYDGRRSTRCPVGSYSPGGSLGACIRCGYGLSTADAPELQTSPDDCHLAPGFGYHDDAIVPCPIGTYNSVLRSNSTTPCSPCPTGRSTSSPGAFTLDHCDVCAGGYGGPNCATQCGGSNGATWGPVGRELHAACVACPAQTVGFSFDFLAANQLFRPTTVARPAADSAADCLNEFSQIKDAAWSLGGAVNLTLVSEVSTFEGCVADCSSDAACQYITFDYDAQTCQKKQVVTGSDLLAFKGTLAGDTAAASQPGHLRSRHANTHAAALSSGSYTFWRDDGVGVGTSVKPVSAGSVKACLAACDADPDCAAVVMAGVASTDSVPASCGLIIGDASFGTFKRSATKTDTCKLTIPEA